MLLPSRVHTTAYRDDGGAAPLLLVQPQYRRGGEWLALAQRANLSFEALEPSAQPALNDPSLLADCVKWYGDCGRVRSLHGVFIDNNPASGDLDIRRISRESCAKSCVLAQRLNTQSIIFHSSAFPFLRGEYLSRWTAETADFFMALTERYGVTVCLENSADLDPEPLLGVMRRTENAQIRVCLDVGHAHYSQVSLERWFDTLGAYIDRLHLSDNGGSFDDHLPLGEGTVDWAQADRLWRAYGRPSPLTIEVGGVAGVEQSLQYLRTHGYFGQEG